MFQRRTHIVLALVVALFVPTAASAEETFTFTGHGYEIEATFANAVNVVLRDLIARIS